MPMYTFSCPICGRMETVIRTMSRRDDAMSCECGEEMHRGIDIPGLVYAPTSSATGMK